MPRAFLDTSVAAFERAFHFNVTTAFALSKLAVPHMLAGDGGRLAARDLHRQVGAAQHRDPLGTGTGDLGDHLAHPQVGAVLDALRAAKQRRMHVRPNVAQMYGDFPQRRRWRNENNHVRIGTLL